MNKFDPDAETAVEYVGRLEAEIDRLRQGIQGYLDGDYGRRIPRKVDKCAHGLFGWESCENCIDAYFLALIDPPSEKL
jgi:hypothetical protein